MKRPGLSVTIIALNEERTIGRCIKSIIDIANEIVVVLDSRSIDRTAGIAKKFGAKVYEREFDNFANQKNFAAEKARGKWIFSIDADEVISPELAKEIKQALQTDKFQGYTIPRKNIILGKFIKHTRWNPELDRHVWLWEKGKGKWAGEVHEEVEVEGRVGKLKAPKVHYQEKKVSEFFQMMNEYSQLESEKIIKQGKNFSFFRLFYEPIYEYLVRYIYRLGFLDGWHGFVLSFLMAIYKLMVWIKVWEKNMVN